ncbi:MAG: universal stress protein [Candidatus Thermoplasmatota archaeon]|nr:universal stress protein [Candidatus Thermoplasmatota archaeon]
MFQNILVPVSSESYSKKAIERSILLAGSFQSKIHLLYIIEDNPFHEMELLTDATITHYNKTETYHTLLNTHRKTADTLIFPDAQKQLREKNIEIQTTIVQGEYSTIIINELSKNKYDLLVMSYQSGCMIDYRIIDEVNVPVWIESGGHHESILAVCSNLAPNQKVPKISMDLAKQLQWDLKMLYVTDLEDKVEVDKQVNRSSPKQVHELLFCRQGFIEKMEKEGIVIECVEGTLQKEIHKAARNNKAGVVIIGREQKKRGKLGFPVKKVKQKIAERCKYSLLFIN